MRMPHSLFAVVVGPWLILVGTGFYLLLRYEGKAGVTADLAQAWPTGSAIELDAARLTLIMFAHPHCPCTRASVDGLTRFLERFPNRIAPHLLVLRPDGVAADWEKTSLWQTASNLPGIHMHSDKNGSEAARFGCTTSGHVLVYHPDGRLLFSGGITPARGHAGDCVGLDLLLAVGAGDTTPRAALPVFGCPLQDPCRACAKETK